MLPATASTPAATPSTLPDDDFETNYVTRIDYNLNQNMKIFGRFTIARENAMETPNQFGGRPTDKPVHRSHVRLRCRPHLGHWRQQDQPGLRRRDSSRSTTFPNDYNPDGSTFFTFGDGADGDGEGVPSSLYQNPSSQARRIPIPMVGDDFAWSKGRPHLAVWRNLQGHPGPRYDCRRLQHDGDRAGRPDPWSLRPQPPAACGTGQSQPAPRGYRSQQPVRLGPDVRLHARPRWQCAERLQLQRAGTR